MIRKTKRLWGWALAMGFAASYAAAEAQTAADIPVKRCMFLVGANSGGPQREKLKYAVSDAKAFQRVMEEMGGVSIEDSLLLVNPDRQGFFREMERIQRRVKEFHSRFSRIEFIFYYSGHSDETHILLGSEKIPYQDIQSALDNVESDVKIAILDSCASGAFTRLKGGQKRSPFLWDDAYNMKGYAVMTSSSSLEASQESDQIGGSFFTHFLISGMRGAADSSRDEKVTLHEAYQFAFDETLARTIQTRGGPQHPNYDIQMNGTGDVIMTDIRQGSSFLRLAQELSGKVFVYTGNKTLAVELNKPVGREVELGLEAGKYHLVVLKEGKAYVAEADLGSGKTCNITADDLVKSKKTPSVIRGWDLSNIRESGVGEIDLHISTGLGNVMRGDIRTWVDEQEKYFSTLAQTYPLRFSGDWKNFQFDMEPEGELRLKLSNRFALSLGAGYLSRRHQSEAVMENDSNEEIRHTSTLQIQVASLKANLYCFFPLRSRMHLFLRGGAAYYFGKINYRFLFSSTGADSSTWERIEGEATDGNLGAHAGIGFEFRLSRKVALCFEGQALYCRINDWEGRETIVSSAAQETIDGILYFGRDKYYFDGWRSLPYFSFPEAKDTRKFTVDLSGFSLKAGLIIRL